MGAFEGNYNKIVEYAGICRECSNRLTVNRHDGIYVCDGCGLVDAVFQSNLPVFLNSTSCVISEYAEDTNDLPKWVTAENDFGHIWQNIQISNLCDHFNGFIHASEDDLASIKYNATKIKQRSSSESKVLCAFVFNYIIKHVDLKRGDLSILKELRYTVAHASYKCDTCDESFYTNKCLSKHKCDWKKRKRRQWSQSKNAQTKIRLL